MKQHRQQEGCEKTLEHSPNHWKSILIHCSGAKLLQIPTRGKKCWTSSLTMSKQGGSNQICNCMNCPERHSLSAICSHISKSLMTTVITCNLYLKSLYSLSVDNNTEHLLVSFLELMILELKGTIKTRCMFYQSNWKKLMHLETHSPFTGPKASCINFTSLWAGLRQRLPAYPAAYSSAHAVQRARNPSPKLRLAFSLVLHSFLFYTLQTTARCRPLRYTGLRGSERPFHPCTLTTSYG